MVPNESLSAIWQFSNVMTSDRHRAVVRIFRFSGPAAGPDSIYKWINCQRGLFQLIVNEASIYFNI